MKTRMLRIFVTKLPANSGPARPADTAREELPAGEPDELAVGREVAFPELARLHQETPEPLQAHLLEPARRTLDEAREHIEAATNADDDRHLQAITVTLAPRLL